MFAILLNTHFPPFQYFTVFNMAHQIVIGSYQDAFLCLKTGGGVSDLAVLA